MALARKLGMTNQKMKAVIGGELGGSPLPPRAICNCALATMRRATRAAAARLVKLLADGLVGKDFEIRRKAEAGSAAEFRAALRGIDCALLDDCFVLNAQRGELVLDVAEGGEHLLAIERRGLLTLGDGVLDLRLAPTGAEDELAGGDAGVPLGAGGVEEAADGADLRRLRAQRDVGWNAAVATPICVLAAATRRSARRCRAGAPAAARGHRWGRRADRRRAASPRCGSRWRARRRARR